MKTGKRTIERFRKSAASVLLFAFAVQPLAAFAGDTSGGVVSDPHAGKNQPVVQQAPNGTALVQITAPSAAGVSNNQFTSFNVGPGGLIFNNSPQITGTQLAGYIPGNLFLGLVPAKVILAQVTVANPSALLGYMEVAGSKADVVIANPFGITCNGCGFINASQATLTTGTPIFGAGGSLSGFSVTGGQLNITGSGLNGTNVDQLNLLGKSISVSGPVWAQTLNAIAGSNQIDYATHGAQNIGGTGSGAPVVYAIDVSNLGGMYAGRIYLLATDAGVGVNSAGTIATQSGPLTLSANGDLTVSGAITSAGSATLNAAGAAQVSGTLYARDGMTLNAQGQLANSGTIAAGSNLGVTASSVTSSGTFAAGINPDGTFAGSGDLTVAAPGAIAANGQNFAAGSLSLSGSGIDLSGSHTGVGGSATLNAGSGDLNLRGATTNAGSLTATGANMLNAGGQLTTAGATTITVGGLFDNTAGVVQAAGALSLTSGAMQNSGQLLSLGSDGLSLATGVLSNSGTIGSNGDVSIIGNVVQNSGTIAAPGTLNVLASSLDNTQGVLGAGLLNLQAGDLSNVSGQITQLGTGVGSIAVSGTLDNTNGKLQSNASDLALTPTTLINIGGTIAHAGTGTLTIATPVSLLANSGGIITTNGTLALLASGVDNSQGTIAAGGSGAIASLGAFDNSQGTVQTVGGLVFNAVGLNNSGGQVVSLSGDGMTLSVLGALANDGVIGGNGAVSIAADTVRNSGKISAGGTLELDASAIDNSGGALFGGLLNVQTGTLTNTGGVIVQSGTNDGQLVVSGTLDNTKGQIASNALDLALAPGQLINAGGSIALSGTGTLTIDTANAVLQNAGGLIAGNGALNIRTAGIENGNGTIQAATAATVATGAFNNNGGTMQAGSSLAVTAATLQNLGGNLMALGSGGMTLAVNGALANSGAIGSNGNVSIAAGSLQNSGKVTAVGNLQVASGSDLTNAGGLLQAGGAAMLTATSLDNTGGAIGAALLNVQGGTLRNAGGQITQSGNGATQIALRGMLDNTGGTIATNGLNFALTTGALTNAKGTIASGGALNLQASSVDNSGGQIAAGASGTIADAGTFDNTGGLVQTVGGLAFNASSLINGGQIFSLSNAGMTLGVSGAMSNSGTIAGNGDVAIAAGTLANSGKITSAGNLQLGVAGTLNNVAGALAAAGTTALAASSIDNSNGSVMGALLHLQANALTNAHGSIVQSGTGATQLAISGVLDNTNGLISTASSDFTLTPSALINTGGTIAHAGSGTFTIASSGDVQNSGGSIETNGTLSLSGANIVNTQGGTLFAHGDGTVSAQVFDNTNGLFQADGALSVSAASAVNAGGQLLSLGNGGLSLQIAGALNNTGAIGGNGTVTIAAGSLQNSGKITATGNLNASASGDLNNAGGSLQSGGTATIRGLSIENAGGAIGAALLNLGGGTLSNGVGGIIEQGGNGAAQLSFSGLVDNAGQILSNGTDLTMNAGALTNGGTIGHGGTGTLTLQVGGALQNAGTIQTMGAASLTAGTLGNAGLIQTAGALAFNLGSGSNSGSIQSVGNSGVSISAQTSFANSNTIGANGDVSLVAGTVRNSGKITSGQNLAVAAGTSLDNTGGILAAANDVTLNAATIINGGTAAGQGTIVGQGLSITAGALSNTNGSSITQLGNGITTLAVSGTLDNTNGTIATNATDLTLTPATLINNNGTIKAAGSGTFTITTPGALQNAGGTLETNGSFAITAASLANAGGTIFAANIGTAHIAGLLDNSKGGTLQTIGGLAFDAASIDNSTGGTIDSSALALQTGTLNNASGTIRQTGNGAQQLAVSGTLNNAGGLIETNATDLTLAPGSLINTGGTIRDAGSGTLSINAGGAFTNDGTIEGNGTVALGVGGLFSNTGKLFGQNISIGAGGGISNAGTIGANGALTLTAPTLFNPGTIENAATLGTITINAAQSVDNSATGQILSNGGIAITTGALNNAKGTISAGSAVDLAVRGALGNAGGSIKSQGTLNVTAGGTLDNTQNGLLGNSGTGATSIAAQAIINDGGTLGGNGATSISGATLSNAKGHVTGGDLGFFLTQLLNNNGGNVFAGGALNFNESGATLDNTNGVFDAVGNMTLNLSSLLNSAGDIESQNSIIITTNTFATGGTPATPTPAPPAPVPTQAPTPRPTFTPPCPACGGGGGGGGTPHGGPIPFARCAFACGGGGVTPTPPPRTLPPPPPSTPNPTPTPPSGMVTGSVPTPPPGAPDPAPTAGGKIIARTDLTINLPGSFTYLSGNQFHANGTMTFNLGNQGMFENQSDLEALGGLTINSGALDNMAGAKIRSGNTVIDAGTIYNLGTLEGVTLTTNGSALYNTATIMGGNLTLNAGTLVNAGAPAVIAAAGTANLYVNSLTNQDSANIFSLGNIAIAKDGKVDANGNLIDNAQSVNNASATIKASNDLAISADGIFNARTTLVATQVLQSFTAGETEAFYDSSGAHCSAPWNCIGVPNGYNQGSLTYDHRITQTVVVAESPQAQLESGGNMFLEGNASAGGHIENNYSLISAGGSLFLGGVVTGASNGSGTTQQSNVTLTNRALELDRVETFTNGVWNFQGTTRCGFLGIFGSCSTSSPPFPQNDVIPNPTKIGSVDAIIMVNGGILGNVGSIDNLTVNASGNSVASNGSSFNPFAAPTGAGPTPTGPVNTGGAPQSVSPPPSDPGIIARLNDGMRATPITVKPGIGVRLIGTTVAAQSNATGTTSGVAAAATPSPITGVPELTTRTTIVPGRHAGVLVGALILPVAVTGIKVASSAAVQPQPLNLSIQVPSNGLYSVNKAPGQAYLVETNPDFANLGNFLSSNYLLQQLQLDPSVVGERLGDGFYEQQVVQQQVTQLTGRQFLPGYASNQNEYQALLDNGAVFAKQFGLEVGIGLTADQMAHLTSDMVWLVWQNVDGQQVLVPKVYLAKVDQNDLQQGGALISARDINLKTGDLQNSGTIVGGNQVSIDATNITNSGSIVSGGDMVLAASNDLINASGTIAGGGNVVLQATHDLKNITVVDPGIGNVSTSTIHATAGISSGGTLTLQAGNDLTITGANVASAGDLKMTAGKDLTVNTAVAESRDAVGWYNQDKVTNLTSTISSGGSMTVLGAGNVNLIAADLNASKSLTVSGATVNIGTATDSQSASYHTSVSSGGLLSSSSKTTDASMSSTTAVGSVLSGDSVVVQSSGNLSVTGSSIVGTNAVSLLAQGNLSIAPAQNTFSSSFSQTSSQSGLMTLGGGSSGGLGFSFGSASSSHSTTNSGVQQVGSTIGSLNGDLTINANGATTITASSLKAAGDLSVGGASVTITAANDTNQSTSTSSQSFSGFSFGFNNSALSAGQTAYQDLQHAGQVQDPRLAALLGIEALQQVQKIPGDLSSLKSIDHGSSFSATLGTSSSQSSSTTDSSTAVGSTLSGKNVTIDARSGDVTLVGASVSASNDLSITAAQNLSILSAQDTTDSHSSFSSSGASVGSQFGFGNAPTLSANVNTSQGTTDASSTTWVGSTLNAAGTLSLQSGGNTSIVGSAVKGATVDVKVAGNLDIQSLQNTNTFNSNSSSAGLSVTMTGNVLGASFNSSNDTLNSNWQSVVTQAGLFAGSGGFNVNVGGNTNLVGAVISSTANASLNSLSTGTLTYSNIQNSSSYAGQNASFGMNYSHVPGQQQSGYNGWNASAPSAVDAHGASSSTTSSAISNGTIAITDPNAQQQSLAGLSRDANQGPNTLAQVDLNKVKEDMQLAGLVGSEASDFLASQAAKIDALMKAAHDDHVPLEQRRADAEEAGKLQKQWGFGSLDRQVLTAAVGALTGNATGSLGQVVQAGVGNFLEEQVSTQIGNLAATGAVPEGSALSILMHAAGACATATIGGGSCSSSALGAGVASAATNLFGNPNDPNMTQSEKQAMANLADTLAGTIGIAAGTSNLAATISSAQSTSENNWLGWHQVTAAVHELKKCATTACKLQVMLKYAAINSEQDGAFYAGQLKGFGNAVVGTLKGIGFLAALGANGTSAQIEAEIQLSTDAALLSDPNVRAKLIADQKGALLAAFDKDMKAIVDGGADNIGAMGEQIGQLDLTVATLAIPGVGEARGVGAVGEAGVDALDAIQAAAGKDVAAGAAESAFTTIGSTGKVGEDFLKTLGGESQVRFDTSLGPRIVDQLVDDVANESKVGYTSLTSDVAKQIAKDVKLMKDRAVKEVVWNFFVSPVTGKGGPSAPLLQALENAGIKVIIRTP